MKTCLNYDYRTGRPKTLRDVNRMLAKVGVEDKTVKDKICDYFYFTGPNTVSEGIYVHTVAALTYGEWLEEYCRVVLNKNRSNPFEVRFQRVGDGVVTSLCNIVTHEELWANSNYNYACHFVLSILFSKNPALRQYQPKPGDKVVTFDGHKARVKHVFEDTAGGNSAKGSLLMVRIEEFGWSMGDRSENRLIMAGAIWPLEAA